MTDKQRIKALEIKLTKLWNHTEKQHKFMKMSFENRIKRIEAKLKIKSRAFERIR